MVKEPNRFRRLNITQTPTTANSPAPASGLKATGGTEDEMENQENQMEMLVWIWTRALVTHKCVAASLLPH